MARERVREAINEGVTGISIGYGSGYVLVILYTFPFARLRIRSYVRYSLRMENTCFVHVISDVAVTG